MHTVHSWYFAIHCRFRFIGNSFHLPKSSHSSNDCTSCSFQWNEKWMPNGNSSKLIMMHINLRYKMSDCYEFLLVMQSISRFFIHIYLSVCLSVCLSIYSHIYSHSIELVCYRIVYYSNRLHLIINFSLMCVCAIQVLLTIFISLLFRSKKCVCVCVIYFSIIKSRKFRSETILYDGHGIYDRFAVC